MQGPLTIGPTNREIVVGGRLMRKSTWRVDVSARPLVRVRFPETPTSASIAEYIERLGHLLSDAPIAVVSDMTGMNAFRVSVDLRQQFHAGIAAHLARREHHLIAEAVVCPGPLLRGLYSAYRWTVNSYSFPSRTFAAAPSAERWALQEIRRWRRERERAHG